MGDPIANYALGKQMRTSCVWERDREADVVRGTQIGGRHQQKESRAGEMKRTGKCIWLK